ncbi:MAG: peptide chain release factor 3 [Pseudomonadota bacterium]|jgi:peptide chain release factor 3
MNDVESQETLARESPVADQPTGAAQRGKSILPEVERRRTFAIISHPDAGKTTLTEKLLLFAGAIQIAGSVKARKASRHATSDWMEIEKQRGISVASSVMQMEYGDCVINLLDTPGHQDFSEDTYRVLTAVDAALMVIDAGNGVEPQTLRLLEVCRARNTPIITFINKLDSEVKDPLDLVDEIEKVLKLTVVPFTWPVGMGKRFAGVYDIRKDQMRLFRSGKDRLETESETLQGFEHPQLADRFGAEFEQAQQEVELISGASEEFDKDAFLRGEQTPLFFGSAINNFGVKEVLDALAELAPPPKPRAAIQRVVKPEEQAFSGVVFKVQANMDPAHRDRIAFVRICSGKFTRGMQLKVGRTGKSMRTASAMSFLSQRRELLEEAYAGDIIGLPNHGLLQLGDTLTEGEKLQYTGLPFFAPEIFQAVEVADPMRAKQLRTGLQQLGEEGAIQVFRPHDGGALLLGAVGTLQFEVVAHRLKHEYGVEARLMPTKHRLARWVTADDPAELKQFIDFNSYRIAYDVVEAPTFLASYQGELVIPERWKTIKYHALREHAGLMFQSKLAG